MGGKEVQMKRVLLFIIGLILFTGCTKESASPEQPAQNDEYYVKYVFQASNRPGSGNQYRICKVGFTGKDGQIEKQFEVMNLDWEVITGPFKRNATITATLDGGGFSNTLIEIYISKNNSPFALHKATNEGSLTDTIDY